MVGLLFSINEIILFKGLLNGWSVIIIIKVNENIKIIIILLL